LDYKGIRLDPFQEQAIGVVDRGGSLLVAAPTGAGKTLIAEYAVEKCLGSGRRAVYTAPIKALSNQKFRDFTSLYGERIGIKTGDVTLNPDAQVLLMTTEIFRNTIFESPETLADVHYCVFDEIHYLDDIERGTVWEESIIFAPPHIRFLCLSATVPNVDTLAAWIRHVRPEVPLDVVREDDRPVPLKQSVYVPGLGVKTLRDLEKVERSPDLPEYFRRLDRDRNPNVWRARLIDHLAERDRLPVLWFAFNRRECEDFAGMVSRPLLDARERARMLELYDDLLGRFALPKDQTTEFLRGMLAKGVAFHHAGLLPTLKEVIERLFTSGLLKLLFATETFAVGVNMPARTVVFNALTKFDGHRLGYIKTREYHQMAGRAGRRGIDPVGYVYAVAEWPWERAGALARVVEGRIEPIRSQFNLSYATLLTLYERLGDRIVQAAEKSFANFGTHERVWRGKLEQMKKKMSVLRALGYLRDRHLTERGAFAKNIQGYELQVTELLFKGVLRQLGEEELAVLFNAVTYEAKKSDWHRRFENPRQRWMRKAAYQAVDRVLAEEDAVDLEDRTQELDFRLASAVHAWAKGCEWGQLESHTSASDGDLVRALRLTLQLMRNALYALPRTDPLRDRLRGAVARINRDVVDAERQLRLGGGADVPPPEKEEEAEPSAREEE
jgi:superfamily II RNA helicase